MKMIDAKTAMQIVGFQKTKFYDMIVAGEFPAGRRSGKLTRWPDHVVVAFAILYWELPEPLPDMSEETLAVVRECAMRAKKAA